MAASFTIKLIFSDHWDSFQLKYPNIRPVVSYEVERVLGCGDPRNGFALYECPRCFRKRFVPFRCHSRFCSTCGSAYQDDRAASIEEKLINCRHRHVVFTIAEELRPYFRKYRNLLHVLFRSAAQVIQDWALAQNKKEQFQFGMVCVLHTFGRDLKWNPHIHMLLTEGACGKISPWKSFHYFPYVMLRKRWMTTLLYNLRQEILSSNLSDTHFLNLVNRFYRIYKDGFYVHAPKSDFNSASAVTKYIVRYIGRTPRWHNRASSIMTAPGLPFGISAMKITRRLSNVFLHMTSSNVSLFTFRKKAFTCSATMVFMHSLFPKIHICFDAFILTKSLHASSCSVGLFASVFPLVLIR